MTTNIEALYMVMDYLDIQIRQDALSLDKFLQPICSFARDQLGVLINIRSMTIGIAEPKSLLMIEEITHWHTRRRSFTFIQGATLCGSLEHRSNTSCWGRFLFLALQDSSTTSLHKTSTIIEDRQIIKAMISELARRPSPADL